MRKPKYLIKIMTTLSILVFIYTMIITVVLYLGNRKTLLRQYDEAMRFSLWQECERIDTQIEVALSMTRQLLSNEYMQEFAQPSGDFNYYYAVAKIRDALDKSTQTYTSNGFSIAVVSIQTQMVVTASSSKTLLRHYNDLGFSTSQRQQVDRYLSQDRAADFVLMSRVKKYSLINEPNDNCVTIVTRSSISAYPVVFFISLDDKTLMPDVNNDSNNFFGMIYDNELVASTSNIPEGLDKASASLEKSNEHSVITKNKFQNSDVLLTRSRHEGWYYLIGIKNTIIKERLTEQLAISGLIYLSILTLSLILALWLSYRMYHPIKTVIQIATRYSPAKSNKNDIEYLQSSVVDIGESNKKLKAIIENNKLPLKVKLTRGLLYGEYSDDIAAGLQEFSNEWLLNEIVVVLIEIANFDILEISYEVNLLQKMYRNITEIMEGMLSDSGISYQLLEMDTRRWTLLLPRQNYSPNLLRNVVKKIDSTFDEDTNLFPQLIMAVSSNNCDAGKISEAYRETLRIINHSAAFQNKVIITRDDLQSIKPNDFYYPLELEHDLFTCTIRCDRDKVMQILREIILQNFPGLLHNKQQVLRIVAALLNTIHRITVQIGESYEDLFLESEKMEVSLKSERSISSLQNQMRDIFNHLIDTIILKRSNSANDINKTMMDYISTHYTDDISLIDVAQIFNVSPGYVSTLFKNATGENFRDCLNRYRVEKAKEIIGKQQVQIKTVAESVGYNSPNVFIRIFRKYEGMSPGEYQKIHGAKKYSEV